MKVLYLLRHAKAGFDLTGMADADRVLTHTGKQDAIKLGYKLKGRNAEIDRFYCSPALRTRQTLELLLEAAGNGEERTEVVPAIYQAGEQTVLGIIHQVPHYYDAVMLIGHNPAMTQLSNLLSRDFRLDHLPTCGLVVIHFNLTHWADIEAQSGEVSWFDFPKTDYSIL
ncbi:MAG: SixA phosphatase family protein [Bacteroidia bacterium]|jgi:phosphohistidine phosphatase